MTNKEVGFRRLGELFGLLSLIFCLTLSFFQIPLEKIAGLPTYSDELLLLFFLGLISLRAFRDADARKLLLIFGIGYVVLFLLSLQAIAHRGLASVLLQLFIHLKVIIYLGFIWLFFGPKTARYIVVSMFVITVFFLLLNMTTGSLFNQVFGVPTLARGGMIRPIGLQADTASLGTTLGLFGIFFVTWVKPSKKKVKVTLLFIFTILLLLSSSRTSLVIVPILVLWWFKESFKTVVVFSVIALISVSFLPPNKYVDSIIEITQQNIEWTTNNPVDSGYIRGIMIYFGVQTANDNFPIGRGAATYGTVFSDDSIVYAELGLRNSWFFIEKEGIYDSNIASLLGEFGYIGTIFYFTLLFKTMTLFSAHNYKLRSEFLFALCATVFAYSVTTPIFMNSYPAFLVALVVAASYRKDEET